MLAARPLNHLWVFFYIVTAVAIALAIAALFGLFIPAVAYFFYAEAVILVFLAVIHLVGLV